MKNKKYVWSVVPLVLVSVLLAANSVGGRASAQTPATPPPPTCIAHPPDLVSWWPADANAQDVIGGNDGTLKGAATLAAGLVGQAFSLDGTVGTVVEVPSNTTLEISSAITVDAWIYLTANGPFQGIVSKADINYLESYALFLADGRPRFLVNTDGSSAGRATAAASSISIIQPYTWTHVAGTYDGANVKVYVNGVLAGTTAHTGTIFAIDDSVLIGASNQGAGPTSYFTGKIDEAEIYNRALTDAEILSIYNANSAGQCKMVRWHIASLSNGSVSSGGAAQAEANDDSLIEIRGNGTFVLGDPDKASGGGAWKIKKEVGGVLTELGRGRYDVVSLVRFVEAPGVFPAARTDNIIVGHEGDARAGLAVFRIKYVDGSPGILVVSCRLHGTPKNVFEGIAASKGAVGYFDPEEPKAGVDMNRTLFHILVQ